MDCKNFHFAASKQKRENLHYIIPLDDQLSHILTFSHLTHQLWIGVEKKASPLFIENDTARMYPWGRREKSRIKKGRKCENEKKNQKAIVGIIHKLGQKHFYIFKTS